MDNKEYRYRKHIRWGQYAIPGFFSCLIIAIWLFILFSFLVRGAVHPTDLLGAIVVTGVLGFEGWLLWHFYYRLAGMRVSIGDNDVIYRADLTSL